MHDSAADYQEDEELAVQPKIDLSMRQHPLQEKPRVASVANSVQCQLQDGVPYILPWPANILYQTLHDPLRHNILKTEREMETTSEVCEPIPFGGKKQ